MISVCLTNIFINFCISAIVNIIAKIKSLWTPKPPVVYNFEQNLEIVHGKESESISLATSHTTSVVQLTQPNTKIKENANRVEF